MLIATMMLNLTRRTCGLFPLLFQQQMDLVETVVLFARLQRIHVYCTRSEWGLFQLQIDLVEAVFFVCKTPAHTRVSGVDYIVA